eukprot:scaffold319382_cov26-Tisochrysis_lutea.AAC.1
MSILNDYQDSSPLPSTWCNGGYLHGVIVDCCRVLSHTILRLIDGDAQRVIYPSPCSRWTDDDAPDQLLKSYLGT